MKLTPVMQKFILHWGEMGNRWGVNRTVSQIHALLYLAEQPLTAEEITEILGVARSNVSTSLKELQSWGLLHTSRELGDRRDRFTTLPDVWAIFSAIMEERKKRELDPTLTLLRECLLESDAEQDTPEQAKTRIAETLELMELLTGWYDQMKHLPSDKLIKLMKLGKQIQSLLGYKPG